MPNQTGQGLGAILDEAAAMCREITIPDVTAVVVTKESIAEGRPFPSMDSFIDGIWPVSGLGIEDVPDEPARVREFDWKKVPSLGLS